MNKEILILCYCDQWHSKQSQKIIACFSNYMQVEKFIKQNYSLSNEHIKNLLENNQTQGLEQNFIILVEKLNPISL